MAAKSSAPRVAAMRLAREALGLRRLELYAHPEDRPAIKSLAAKLARKRANATSRGLSGVMNCSALVPGRSGMDTPTPMQGEWTLVRPDGKRYKADGPLKCVSVEMQERVPADVALARVMAAASEPDFAERHLQLAWFYNAKNTDDLIDKMEGHIARLQGRLLSPAARVAEVHMSRYTLEWLDGPLPEGTILHKALPVADQGFSFAPQRVREG